MKAIMSEICLHNSIVPVAVAGLAVLSSYMEMGIHTSLHASPKNGLLYSFEFLGLWQVFMGVKINSKNFENRKNIWLFSKILSK